PGPEPTGISHGRPMTEPTYAGRELVMSGGDPTMQCVPRSAAPTMAIPAAPGSGNAFAGTSVLVGGRPLDARGATTTSATLAWLSGSRS
ncbi:MAG: hypothetical protein AAGC63_13875, partial [Propionicimonas sp.]